MQTQCLTALSTINTNHCIYILSLRLNFESFLLLPEFRVSTADVYMGVMGGNSIKFRTNLLWEGWPLQTWLPQLPRAVGKLWQAGTVGRASATPTKQTHKPTHSSEWLAVTRAEASKQLVGSYSVGSSVVVCALDQVEGHKVNMVTDTWSAVTLIHRHLLDTFTLPSVGRSGCNSPCLRSWRYHTGSFGWHWFSF